jgi:hypothetical protein
VGTAVALKGSTADQLPTSIHSSTAFTEGLFGHILFVECAAPHVVPSLVECDLSLYLYKFIRFVFKQPATRTVHVLSKISKTGRICKKYAFYPI